MSFIKIPQYTELTDTWNYREFTTREEFVDFLWSMYKEPGKYKFDKLSEKFNEQARKFNRDHIFCFAPSNTKDFKIYWETEKEKCRFGAIFVGTSGNVWYLTRYYYMWLNFLPLYNKEINKFGFPDVRDVQYHIALYCDIARYSYKHAAILKKRQIASSYFHAGIIINNYVFEEGSVNKIAGALKDYINEKGTWRFLDEYKNFINQHTAWYRPSNPEKTLNWQQKIEQTVNKRKIDKGNKSVVLGYALDKDPTNGVGGSCSFFFHEEAGIAARMNETIEYLLPALKDGMIYTGWYSCAGSVGDLDQCEPLREMIMKPDSKSVLAVETNLVDANGTIAKCGLFIPEQWSMRPCIDVYGNSLVEEALKMILEERLQWKKDNLKGEDYQLRVSQKPINIEEAFAYRKESKFPQHLVTAQIRRIEDKTYFTEYIDIYRDENGFPAVRNTKKLPISEFPINPSMEDKSSVLVVYERPCKDPKFGDYYASIDPVGEGKTVTSDSLCSIVVYKTTKEIITIKPDGTKESRIERDGIVAEWCGRFDDIIKTHERLELIIEWYNAWTVIENNVSLFIQYMIGKRKQKYLVPKNQILFLKELGANTNVFQEYGWKNVGTIFKTNLLSYGIEYLKEVIDIETDKDGNIKKSVYGIERIPSIMLMEEMKKYQDGLNVDRLISYCALIAFAKIQESNTGYKKRVERDDSNLDKSNKNTKLKVSPFRHMGNSSYSQGSKNRPRNPFKNIR